MSQELIVDAYEYETRVALYRDEILQDVHIERDGRYSLTGSIYRGRVDRLVPGIQAAFVEFGGDRPGFLHVRDVVGESVASLDLDNRRVNKETHDPSENPVDIRGVLHEGQSVLVQVSKDPIGGKGARLTTNLTLAGRYLVLMPYTDRIGVSQRIRDEAERERLRNSMEAFRYEMSSSYGYIVRTVAEGVPIDDLQDDVEFLERVWHQIAEKAKVAEKGEVVYQDLPLHTRAIRDLVNAEVRSIVVNDEATLVEVKKFVKSYMPEYLPGVTKAIDSENRRRKLDAEIEKALSRKVMLPSGGNLLIESTEALCTVDVNTGRFVGSENLEDTAFKTNMEAARVIARELRVRNIGGLVVVDFIDMDEVIHRGDVMRVFERSFDGDPSRVQVGDFSEFGLVELSRKRTRKSLAEQLGTTCSKCGGEGISKNLETTCFDLFRALHIAIEALGENRGRELRYLVRTGQEVVDRMLGQESDRLELFNSESGCAVSFEVDKDCGFGQFTLVQLSDLSAQ
ncbi:MAG: Rne/Rng family ribonuclease [Pseudomonadales bacterium]|nr:Rne/Rng family ribonuclease [Pseudomonadales bacterium]